MPRGEFNWLDRAGALLTSLFTNWESTCMRNRSSVPGFSGIAGIIAALLAVSAVITLVTGTYVHWPLVLLGIGVGLLAVRSING
jgi:hypothetical protein